MKTKIFAALRCCLIAASVVSCTKKPEHTGFVVIDKDINAGANVERIRQTVIFKNKIVTLTSDGRLVCLNALDFSKDASLTNVINSDTLSRISLISDTLFAEKSNKIFYWNSVEWKEYLSLLPINYFGVLLEDSIHIFSTSPPHGEFGSVLFAYNRQTKQTRAKSVSYSNSLLKTKEGYLVGEHSWHMGGRSRQYVIKEVAKMTFVPDSILDFENSFRLNPKYDFLFGGLHGISQPNLSWYNLYSKDSLLENQDEDYVIVSNFKNSDRIYHVIHSHKYKSELVELFIGTAISDTLRIVDTLSWNEKKYWHPDSKTRTYKESVIVEKVGEKRFLLIRNDTIFNVTVGGQY